MAKLGRGPRKDDLRWAAVVTRDTRANFVYAVESTGVYCRPACPSRRPLRSNVTFYEAAFAAELAGFRPCKRCRPSEHLARFRLEAAQPVVKMCQMLEERESEPGLRELAAHAGWSKSYAQRLFLRVVGLTPKQYRAAIVRARVQRALLRSRNVSEAIYLAGFNASSRFYEHVAKALGMKPSQYRTGASGKIIHFAVGDCSLGAILVAATDRGVCAVSLGDDREALIRDLRRLFPHAEIKGADPAFDGTVAQVVRLVDAKRNPTALALPLDIQGTAFQERVWRVLMAIPHGKTATYAEVARTMGQPSATRAVASACAKNNIAVLIPCHRVVRSDGALSGYRWGVERKRELLRKETARQLSSPLKGDAES